MFPTRFHHYYWLFTNTFSRCHHFYLQPIKQLPNKCASDNNLKPKHTAAILCNL